MRGLGGKQNAKSKVPRRRDCFEIRLAGQDTVKLFFRNSRLLPKGLWSDARIKAVEDTEKIRQLWTDLTERRRLARLSKAD